MDNLGNSDLGRDSDDKPVSMTLTVPCHVQQRFAELAAKRQEAINACLQADGHQERLSIQEAEAVLASEMVALGTAAIRFHGEDDDGFDRAHEALQGIFWRNGRCFVVGDHFPWDQAEHET